MAMILIIDDDPDVLEVCRLLLEKAGHEVVSSENKEEGMSQVEKKKPELIILDVMMENPDDGIVMARDIKRKNEDIPIVMLTAINEVSGLEIDKDEEINPVNEFLSKPIDSATLVSVVERLLEQKEN